MLNQSSLTIESSLLMTVLGLTGRSNKLVFVCCVHTEGSWWFYRGDEVLPHRCVQNLCCFWWWHSQRAEFWGPPKSDIVSNPRLWPWPPWSLVRTVLVWTLVNCSPVLGNRIYFFGGVYIFHVYVQYSVLLFCKNNCLSACSIDWLLICLEIVCHICLSVSFCFFEKMWSWSFTF